MKQQGKEVQELQGQVAGLTVGQPSSQDNQTNHQPASLMKMDFGQSSEIQQLQREVEGLTNMVMCLTLTNREASMTHLTFGDGRSSRVSTPTEQSSMIFQQNTVKSS